MGIIQHLIESIRARKQEQKSQVSEDINDYIESEKMKNRIAFIKRWEREDFFTRGNFPNE